MIQETIQKIEAQLTSNAQLPPEKRAELLALLATLKEEVGALSQTHAEDARSIAGFAAVSAHEATRSEVKPDLLEHSLGGLARSVQGLEATHPRLVQVVNSICTTLSNLGI
jgi:hypothetical protein